MKKLFLKQGLLMVVGGLLLVGCFDNKYDFDKVDLTLGFGGDQVALPGNNSTSAIVLDDLLDIQGSDLIWTDAKGDYWFGKSPETVNPVSVTIDPITLSQDLSAGQNIDITIPDVLRPFAGQTITLSDYGQTMEGSQAISLLDYEFAAPEEVKSLKYVVLGDNGADLTLNLTLPSDITKFGYITISFPQMLEMTCVTKPENFDATTNILSLRNQSGGNLQLQFKVTRINVKKVDDDNYAELANGKFSMKGKVQFAFGVDQLRIPSQSTITIGGEGRMQGIRITGARGVFDPDINMTSAGTVTITGIPDFLIDEEVVADLDNPQIFLTLTSTMPLGGVIEAQLTSDTYQGAISLTGDKAIHVKASPDGQTPVETKVIVCRKNPGVSESEYQVITDDNLSKLINKLREGMTIRFDINKVKAAQEEATVLMGHQYSLVPNYRFEAPLAFGPNAVIVYTKSFDGWNSDIDKLSLATGAFVELKGIAVNQIPADLVLEADAIGTNGQKLSDVTIDLVKNSVAGVTTGSSESEIDVKVSGNISKLDGLKIKLKAASNESLRGVTLNKTTQTLILKNVDITLNGKLIYDAN